MLEANPSIEIQTRISSKVTLRSRSRSSRLNGRITLRSGSRTQDQWQGCLAGVGCVIGATMLTSVLFISFPELSLTFASSPD